jgi:hypothetical protein
MKNARSHPALGSGLDFICLMPAIGAGHAKPTCFHSRTGCLAQILSKFTSVSGQIFSYSHVYSLVLAYSHLLKNIFHKQTIRLTYRARVSG